MEKAVRTSAQHLAKNHHIFSGNWSPISSGRLSRGRPVMYCMTWTLARTTLMSAGVAQGLGSLGSVLQMSVTLSIMSDLPSSLQKDMQTSCMQYPMQKGRRAGPNSAVIGGSYG